MRVGLESPEKELPARILSESEAILGGFKDFVPPNGLGSIRSTRCYIIVLRDESKLDLSGYFKTHPTESGKESLVWNWTARLGEFGDADSRVSSLYATLVARSYILVSKDRAELLKVSTELASANGDTEILTRLRGWSDFEQHDSWAIENTDTVGFSRASRDSLAPTKLPTSPKRLFFT